MDRFAQTLGSHDAVRAAVAGRVLRALSARPAVPRPPPAWCALEASLRSSGKREALLPFLTAHSRPVPRARPGEWPGSDPRCALASWERGPRFRDRQLGDFVVSLFRAARRARARAGVRTSFSPYDLHHGHLFLSRPSWVGDCGEGGREDAFRAFRGAPGRSCAAAPRGWRRGRLGVLFHAAEYPAYDPASFPYDLGYCQRGSDVSACSPAALATRSVVWFRRAAALDARALPALFDPLLRPLGTALEEDFGTPIADVYFLPWTEIQGGERGGGAGGEGAGGGSWLLRRALWVFPRFSAPPRGRPAGR